MVRAAILQPAHGAESQRLPQQAWGGNPDPGGIKGSWIRLTEAGQCVVCHGGDSKVFPLVVGAALWQATGRLSDGPGTNQPREAFPGGNE